MKRGGTVSGGREKYTRREFTEHTQSHPPATKEHLYERMRERSPQEPFIKRFIKWWRT